MKSKYLYKIQIMVIYSQAILVAVMSGCSEKRVICKTSTGTLANTVDPDQKLQNLASEQDLHCLIKLQGVNPYPAE